MTPLEIEFIAQQSKVEIIPKIKMSQLNLIGGTIVEPLRPPRKSLVPLWMAQELSKRNLCQLVLPDWMSISNLTQALEQERMMPGLSPSLPFHYQEIAKALLSQPADDQLSQDMGSIRSLVYDIQTIRARKIRESIDALNEHVATMRNVSAVEINTVRPFLVEASQCLGDMGR
eukprot:Partr_v1_DN26360_c0_g1_i2_m43268 putative DNA replication complex GINS protein psf2